MSWLAYIPCERGRVRYAMLAAILFSLTPGWSVFAQSPPLESTEQLSPAGPQTSGDQHRVPQRSIATAIAHGSISQTILVGVSGQLYRPAGPGRWQRSTAGGVAVDITDAVFPGRGPVMVAGVQSPLYRMIDGVWHTIRLPRRGRVLLATSGGVPLLAIQRQLYVWKTDAWTEVARARANPAAIWASSHRRIYVALETGVIEKWRKGNWSRLSHPLASGDVIRHFEGRPGKKLYAFAMSGAILDVGARHASAIGRSSDLDGLSPQAADVTPDGTLWLAGLLRREPDASPDAPPEAYGQVPSESPNSARSDSPTDIDPTDIDHGRLVLVTRAVKGANKSLALVEHLQAVSANARITVLQRDQHGDLLIATSDGRVHYRETNGAWTRGQLADALPVKQPTKSTGPARTR